MSEIRVNKVINEAGTGSVELTQGATLPSGKTLSGAGSISVTGNVASSGQVSGATGSFTGSVSIGGTLTYEDVTNIDAVGIITAQSGVSIGDSIFHTGDTNTAIRFPAADTFTVETAGSERVRITSVGAAVFKGGLVEKYENAGTTLGAQTNNPLSDGNIILFTGNESGNLTINFTGVHATIDNGQAVSFTAIITPNNSGKINAVQIDGQTPAGGLKWSGGSAPSASSSGLDVYTFTILKTGTGNTAYTVFGAAQNYA